MTRQRSVMLAALLEHGRRIPAVPAAVRGRVLARARASAASEASAPQPHSPRRPAALHPVALVAAAALVTSIAGAVVSLRARKSPAPVAAGPALVRPQAPAAWNAPLQAPPLAPVTPPAPSAAERRPTAKSVSPRESYAAELELLRSAQAAYAGGDLAGSLRLLNEHARQFPAGRLAEERDALRVSCLKGLGRSNDARRAAASFAERFPHSVLLPRTTATDPPASD